MSYSRRVVKRRPASLTEEEWLQAWERGKLPREPMRPLDGNAPPPVDVYDLVYARQLSDLRWRLEVLCMTFAKPSTSPSSNGPSSCTASQGQLLSQFSHVWEFLQPGAYLGGSPRQGGTISLKLHKEGLQVTLTDPSSGSFCCLTHPSLDDALLAFEVGLADGSLPWRPSAYADKKKVKN